MMCCGWYALGKIDMTDTARHWIDGFVSASPEYVYLAAYHWVLAQITLGSNDVNPTNSYERIFCILLNVFGLLYSSTIVSIVSARRERMEDISYLAKFLEQHQVSSILANRVLR